jgi:hypothetical protein
MECPHCKLSTSIEDGRCALCGWRLAACPACGAANETTARLCSSCATVLIEERALEDPADLPDDSGEPHHIY